MGRRADPRHLAAVPAGRGEGLGAWTSGSRASAALVTGGASGIGAAIAAGLAREGCDITIVDRAMGRGVAALQPQVEAAGRRLCAIEADVRDFGAAEQAVRTALEEFGRLDILVANAGITADAPSWKMTEDQWDAVLSVNLKGCFAYARAAAALFREQTPRADGLRRLHQRPARQVRAGQLRGVEGRRDRARQDAGPGAGEVRRERQRGRPRDGADPARRGAAGRGGAARDGRDGAGPPRRARGHRRRGGLPLLRARARHITGAVVQVDGGQYI